MTKRTKKNRSKDNKGRNPSVIIPLLGGLDRNVLVRSVIVVAGLICLVEVLNLYHGDVTKDYKVRSTLSISGATDSCGHFNAWGVASIGRDRILVVDQGGNRLLLFDRQGDCVKSWGKAGSGPGEFHEPSGATSDGKGHVFVMDTWNTAIKGYDENGKQVLDLNLANKNLYGPRGIGFDGRDFVLADTGSHRIALISPDGSVAATWGRRGTGEGEYQGPQDVAADGKGHYFVADTENHRVQCLDQDGRVTKVLKFKKGVASVAVDAKGRLFVSTSNSEGYSCIKAYTIQGDYLGDLRDEKGGLVPGDRGLTVTPEDTLVCAGGDHVYFYQLPDSVR
ncbi:MAG TPA: NHL repeat-containing protein [bacterium]|nr:NHL repeat-containing protein [bacterium]